MVWMNDFEQSRLQEESFETREGDGEQVFFGVLRFLVGFQEVFLWGRGLFKGVCGNPPLQEGIHRKSPMAKILLG
jgi:hypothetical protein